MLVRDIMVKEVINVKTETLLGKVADVLHDHNLEGVPVVNEYGIVEGLITENELFSEDRKIYLPMYGDILKKTEFVVRSKEDGLPYEAGRIMRITAKEIMNRKVYFANPDMEVKDLVVKAANLRQNPIPVVDYGNRLMGLVSKGDLLRAITGTPKNYKENGKTKHYVENEVKSVVQDMSSRFAFISKKKAHYWIFIATVLFILGFLIGIMYVVNPKIFISGT